MYSNGYICRNPERDDQMHHYDMNLCYIDELLWHIKWTGDLDYARKMWPVLTSHIAWEKRNFDPDGDGLYDAYCCIWASDALYYNSGAVTHSSAYNYRANKIMAEIAEKTGQDPAPYRAEADKILTALNSTLWMDDKGVWAEYKDFTGHKRLHDHPALLAGLAAAAVIIALTFRADTLNLRLPGWMATVLMCAVITGAVLLPSRLAFLDIKDYNRFLVWESQGSDNLELINARQLNYASPLSKSMYLAKYVTLQSGLNKRWRQVQQGVMKTRIESDSDPDLQLVIVIGESFIKSHSSLYGYHLNVNPILEREFNNGNLTVFSDYITSANFTVASIRNLINTNCLDSNDGTASDWYESAYLPAAFAQGGWLVNLFSNQYAPGDAKGDLGGMLFDSLMTDSCYSAYNQSTLRFDLDFVDAITDSLPHLNDARGHSLDIWHLKGQHFPPSNDFPQDNSEFRRYSYKDIPADRDWLDKEKRQVVADYANATAYNDSVVGQILNLYRDKKAIVVYFSDHGEEMYDTAPFANRNRQRPENPEWLHRQFDIPMFIWFSDLAKEEMPELWDAVVESGDKPGMLDTLPQMLMHFGGLTKSSFYSPTHDILSTGYKAYPRITALGYRYDN